MSVAFAEATKVTEKGVVSASEIFGYEPLVDTDRETFVGTTEFLYVPSTTANIRSMAHHTHVSCILQ
jgi:hypothetical protein